MKSLPVQILMIVAFSLPAKGQDVKVTAGFDSSRIYIGDQIHFTVTVEQPSDLVVALPVLKDTLCRNIEILSGSEIDSSLVGDNRIRITSRYLITSFDSGFYHVPPVFAEIKNENGIKRFYSEYSLLEVMRVMIAPADTTAKIYDIIEPYRAPVTLGEVLPWIFLAVIAVAAAWFLAKLFRKLIKKRTGKEPVINPDPAHVIAFRDLEKLREEKLWQKGEIKQYYSRLTEIIRQYLENRFGVFSLELTTSETLDALIRTGFKKDNSYAKLKSVLTGSDLVKFARYKPEPSENELHFEDSWEFVLTTKKQDEITEPVNKKDTEKEETV
ncbi:MAG: hypothetical protein MUO72_18180 [Bacteroidales bacterium]|nr:hypothetical protein [Bacteroidales bacterium]